MYSISHLNLSLMLPLKYQILKVTFLAALHFRRLRHVISQLLGITAPVREEISVVTFAARDRSGYWGQSIVCLPDVQLDLWWLASCTWKCCIKVKVPSWVFCSVAVWAGTGRGPHLFPRGPSCLFLGCKASLCQCSVSSQIWTTQPTPFPSSSLFQLLQPGLSSAETPECRASRGGVEWEG